MTYDEKTDQVFWLPSTLAFSYKLDSLLIDQKGGVLQSLSGLEIPLNIIATHHPALATMPEGNIVCVDQKPDYVIEPLDMHRHLLI